MLNLPVRHLLATEVPGEDVDTNLWWFGAIVYVTGSILINLGSNIIRYSHERIKHFDVPPPIYRRFWWILGFSIFGIGNLFNFVGFMFAAQSLLVGLGSIQFISNLAFARCVNKEPITKQGILATSIIVCGNIVIVVFGSKSSETYDLDQLLDLFLRVPFIIYLCLTFFLAACLQVFYVFVKCIYLKKTISPHPAMLRFIPLCYAAVSAIIGTCSVTIGKALSGIVLLAFEPNANPEQGELKTIWPYLLLVLFVGITVFWLYRMNHALKIYDAMFIIPVLQALWLLFAVLGGGIFYQEFLNMSLLQNILYATGILVLLCGVSVFSPRPPPVENSADTITLHLDPQTPGSAVTIERSASVEKERLSLLSTKGAVQDGV